MGTLRKAALALACATAGLVGGAALPSVASPPGGLVDLHPIAWDAWEPISSTSLRVFAWTGAPSCEGTTATAQETSTTITITVLAGTVPGVDNCPSIAMHAPIEVTLAAPIGLRQVTEPGGIPASDRPYGTKPAPAVTSARPGLVGTARVGRRLSAVAAGWTYGTSFSYRWYAGARPIPGATGASMRVTRALIGQRISVRVRGSHHGYSDSAWIASRTTGKVRPRN